MSIRQFRPRHDRRSGLTTWGNLRLYFLLLVAIGSQIAYALVVLNSPTSNEAKKILTLAYVIAGGLFMSAHARFAFGNRFGTTYFLTTFTLAFLVEWLGSSTGWPFGQYSYNDSLGPRLLGVPLVVPCAWLMMVYPMLLIGRKLSTHWPSLIAGAGLMFWDLYIDPTMVADGRWTWKADSPSTPFAPHIPLSNSIGWLLVGFLLASLLHKVLPKERRKKGISVKRVDYFVAWTIFSGFIGGTFFFNRPGVTIIATLGLLSIYAPYILITRFGRPEFD
jgi:putative membrane protein